MGPLVGPRDDPPAERIAPEPGAVAPSPGRDWSPALRARSRMCRIRDAPRMAAATPSYPRRLAEEIGCRELVSVNRAGSSVFPISPESDKGDEGAIIPIHGVLHRERDSDRRVRQAKAAR